MGNRIGAWAIALVVGAFYGAAGSVVHSAHLLSLPLGLALAILGSAALVVAMRLLTGDRWAALAGGLGMVVATWVLSLTSPGGSMLFTNFHPVEALVWQAATPLVTALVVAWPDLSGIRSRESR